MDEELRRILKALEEAGAFDRENRELNVVALPEGIDREFLDILEEVLKKYEQSLWDLKDR